MLFTKKKISFRYGIAITLGHMLPLLNAVFKTKKHQMKTLILLVAVIFATFNSAQSNSISYHHFTSGQHPSVIKSLGSTSQKPSDFIFDYPIVFQLSSPHHFIDGCEYWVTITVAYIFDDDNNYLGFVTSSPTLNYNCGGPEIMETRGLEMTANSDSQSRASSIEFGLTGDPSIDRLLSSQDFRNEIKALINDNIPTP